ncbi:hypothetical protein [Streptomyces spirodelae]|uniref:Serine/threonine protein kinase n=1 Tax=Streptomyces spirodelae TaxID=2812904 RepID=A0ABS3WNV7_9ACTN|nr:hypothetical protein [Streptomyces spirodelae]MBO8184800.1 hypothetical protein [Streptomyces spirodelae]
MALALTLSGCADGETGNGGEHGKDVKDGKNREAAERPQRDHGASASPGKESASSRPDSSAAPSTRSAHPSGASGSSRSSAAPESGPARADAKGSDGPASGASASTADGERASGNATASRASGGKRGIDAVQGTWYFPYLVKGKPITFTVTGGSYTFAGQGASCSGPISRSLRISVTCRGLNLTGQARVSEDGRTLTLDWENGKPDRFTRAQPR